MSKKLYVSNLAFSMSDASLEELFQSVGQVLSAKVITDRVTGRSKGFGFVEMASADASQTAISALNGMSVDGRNIIVNLSRPREEGRSSGGRSEFRPSSRPNTGYGNDGYGGGNRY